MLKGRNREREREREREVREAGREREKEASKPERSVTQTQRRNGRSTAAPCMHMVSTILFTNRQTDRERDICFPARPSLSINTTHESSSHTQKNNHSLYHTLSSDELKGVVAMCYPA